MSYVTGSHTFKTGFTTTWGKHENFRSLSKDAVQYTFRNQVPIQLTEWTSPTVLRSRITELGLFVQDQWRIRQLTLYLGGRYDTFHARTLAEHLPPARFVGPRDYPAVDNVPNWKDFSPRIGGAYDLFGNGKTAIKASLGRYIISAGATIPEANHPANQEVSSATRTWDDSFYPVGDPRRGNYVPDCDLFTIGGSGECGPLSNPAFGTIGALLNRFDPAVLTGFGERDYNWQGTISLQHELRPGVGLGVGYFRRWYGNFRASRERRPDGTGFRPVLYYGADGSTPADVRPAVVRIL